MFEVELLRIRPLSPTLSRFTFTGPDLDQFADNGYDQRIKLVFPLPGIGLESVPTGDDWYSEWRSLPVGRQNPIRTYTVRQVRADEREIDVDIVLHGDAGPASAWASRAQPGDPLVILGPNRGFDGVCGGVDFVPPAHTETILLVGDETALPAIASILERLAPDARGLALVEVPHLGDAAALVAHVGVEVRVVARGAGDPGSALLPAVRAATGMLLGPGGRGGVGDLEKLDDVDVDSVLLWEVPVSDAGVPLCESTELYAWVAGEAGVVKEVRRHLVRECGLDRASVAFMGYWRLGRADI
ncbi:siderophore-interacting protein [Subtercola vilae]|uniref:Siderophore-interacting protein n=2 Tax=Microbacteriaceae TaxID=85023 RepID=A0A4T2C284_9MICO|nr:siderophore-interacting protein [Subtercola vilae]